jgi:hypothetical protein
MENINFVTNQKGEKIALLIDLKKKNKITPEYLEDIEDIVAYELLRDQESVDYKSSINELLKKKAEK